MCQTILITKNIVRLSRRTYNQRIDSATPNHSPVSKLSRLNKDLDKLYETLYDEWQSIGEKDYEVFGPQLTILLETIKALYNSYKKIPKEKLLRKDVKKLGMNYAALYEINSDIISFKIKLPKDTEMKSIMTRLSEVDNKLREK